MKVARQRIGLSEHKLRFQVSDSDASQHLAFIGTLADVQTPFHPDDFHMALQPTKNRLPATSFKIALNEMFADKLGSSRLERN